MVALRELHLVLALTIAGVASPLFFGWVYSLSVGEFAVIQMPGLSFYLALAGSYDSTYGTLGGELFDAFFRKYEMKLSLDVGAKAKNAVAGQSVVRELERFCKNPIQC
mgnify:CR=1 FL=1